MSNRESSKRQVNWRVLLLVATIGWGSITPALRAAISSEQELTNALTNQKWAQTVSLAHAWLVEDPVALIPKVRGAQALIAMGNYHSANFYLKKIAGTDWQKRGNENLREAFFEIYCELTKHLPWGELVEIPDYLLRTAPKEKLTAASAYALGFDAYSKNQFPIAQRYLQAVEGDRKEDATLLRVAIQSKLQSYPNGITLLSAYDSDRANLAKARLHYAMKDYAQAESFYEKLEKPTADQLRELAWALVAQKKFQPAMELLQREESKSAATLSLLGYLYLQKGDRAAARTATLQAEATLIKSELDENSFEWKKAALALEKEREAITQFNDPAFRFLREQVLLGNEFSKKVDAELKTEAVKFRQAKEKLYLENRIALSEALIPEKTEAPEYAESVFEALRVIEEASDRSQGSSPEVEMRRAELSWKASTVAGDPQSAQSLREKALNTSERLYRTFPKFSRRDHNIFFLALVNIQLGREKIGYDLLGEFTKLAPKHARTPDAYRLRGDIEFDARRFADAEKSYAAVLTFPRARAVGYAQYKLGWTNYHQRKFDRSLRWFEEALAWCDQWEKNPEVQALEKESRRDLISVFAETGDSRIAPIYFEKFLRGESKSWIVELAKKLDSKGQYEKSAELYRYLIRKDPNADENMYFWVAIVQGEGKLRKWSKANEAATELTKVFGPVLQAPPADDATVESSPPLYVEERFKDALVSFHQEQAPSMTSTKLLDEMSLNYLRTFRKWGQAEPIYLRQAESLAARKLWEDAAVYYREYWSRFGAKIAPEIQERALRGFIQALEALGPQGKQLKIGSQTPTANSAELDSRVNDYQKLFPTSPHIRKVSYLGAFSLLIHGEMEKGINACQKIFDLNPVDEQGKSCFDNLRAAAYQNENWRGTFEWATEIYQRTFPGIEIFHPQLLTIRTESLLKWAEGEKDDEQSAATYLFALKYRELRPLWEKALYNAFVRYHRAQNFVETMQVADRLEQEYPASNYLPAVAATRAAIYQQTGDYERAYPQLVFYLRKIKEGVNDSTYAQALLNAGAAAVALSKPTEANYWIALYERHPQATLGEKGLAKSLLGQLAPKRSLAAIPQERWDSLANEKGLFENTPLERQASLPQTIKVGALKLDRLARQYLDLSGNQNFEGNESLCALPLLYSAFERGLRDLALNAGESTPQILQLAPPLHDKAKEFASDCLKRAADVEHDGPYFRQVNAKWGWEWDPILAQRTSQLVRDLGEFFPQFDPISINRDEQAILTMHLQKVGSAESWYTLVRQRCQKGATPLCRLTLTDALTQFPTSGKLLNATAIYFGKESRELPSSLYTRAADQGSVVAIPNLAYYHLKEARVSPGLSVLKKAYYEKYFDFNDTLKESITTWVEQ